MGADEELAKSLARFDATSREYADRRALREREQAAASAQVREGFAKQGATMQKFVEHYQELGRRKRKAGGWATSSAIEDRPVHLSFDTGEEPGEPAEEATPPRPAPQRSAPRYPDSLSGAALFAPHQPSEPQPSEPEPSEPEPSEPERGEPAAAQPVHEPKRRPLRPSRRPKDGDDPDDDLSNHQWMR